MSDDPNNSVTALKDNGLSIRSRANPTGLGSLTTFAAQRKQVVPVRCMALVAMSKVQLPTVIRHVVGIVSVNTAADNYFISTI